MEHIVMDLGKKQSQIAILTEAGELIEKWMRTERERLMPSTVWDVVAHPGQPLERVLRL